MKTEKIAAALRCCRTVDCGNCPKGLVLEEAGPTCYEQLLPDAADRLEELVDRCARYAEEIAVLRQRQRWIPVTERLPETDEFVLAVVSGKPTVNITLENAVQLASFWRDDGWAVSEWPEWEDPQVSYWMPLPEAPEEG